MRYDRVLSSVSIFLLVTIGAAASSLPVHAQSTCGHATQVVSFVPGTDTSQTSAINTLGLPDEEAVPLGEGGVLVLRIGSGISNGSGADLTVFENGNSVAALNENFRVEVSFNGTHYVMLGECPGDPCSFDLQATGFYEIRYVRITDLPPPEPGAEYPNVGADIDAVTALSCPPCPDVNGDGVVGAVDQLRVDVAFASSVGSPRFNSAADVDANGMIDGNDLALVASAYGRVCP